MLKAEKKWKNRFQIVSFDLEHAKEKTEYLFHLNYIPSGYLRKNWQRGTIFDMLTVSAPLIYEEIWKLPTDNGFISHLTSFQIICWGKRRTAHFY